MMKNGELCFVKSGRLCLEGFGGGDAGGICICFFFQIESNWNKNKNQGEVWSQRIFCMIFWFNLLYLKVVAQTDTSFPTS